MSARWDSCLAALQAHGRLPSVVAGVLQGGELVWTGAAGAGSVDERFRIGSITKTVTAVAVLQARDAGLLSLDDPIGSVVPETGYRDVTVRELLAHTGGLQSEPVGSWWERSPGVDFATLVAANDASGSVSEPGGFHYSNLGFALLGEAVARVHGASWWDVVSAHVLAPLGLDHTSYDDAAPAAQGWSVDHFAGTLTREPHQDTGAMAPAGQLWSTVADLATFALFLADGHPDVLSRESLAEMVRPTSPTYGLGTWLLELPELPGRRLVGHPGSMPGFQASLFVDPETRDGVVVLASSTTGLDTDTVPGLLLGDRELTPLEPWVPTQQVPAGVRDLLGLWFWGNSAVEVRWHNEQLHLRSVARHRLTDVFEVREAGIVGTWGYHRGERLRVHRRRDRTISHLECATFVYTRTPYDPTVPIPGGHPA